ncbi:MAG TPA: hypothetical protein VG294_12065 [Solirubrobacteraceae bacterium]|nr:hypothetical protein [Solirubrobacteraceae bacterium]
MTRCGPTTSAISSSRRARSSGTPRGTFPWEAARGLDDTTERAVAQVMTVLAQNEYAALYVPARFLPHVNPQLTELVLWLGSHVHDEARHLEVFTKRSLAGGYRGYAGLNRAVAPYGA